jgi:hypothetical protein
VYTVQGCTDTIDVYIQEIWAGWDMEVCDSDTMIQLTQMGSWAGAGTYLPLLNAFDISMLGPGEYYYTITAFGCSDDFRLIIHDPYADLYEPVSLCLEDQWIAIADIADYSPDWGDFSGPSIVESNDEWYFNPLIAGPGTHTIIFEAVGCQDSFTRLQFL